ncbi:MAG: pentapeptide repeat-containing protein [Sedimenticola sp.]
MSTPKSINNPLYNLLKSGHVEAFNQHRKDGETCDLQGANLRGFDLREIDTEELDLSDCYLHQADLRGLDLSNTPMEGASISGARIAGTYFPVTLSAEEITLSLQHGTRMRYQS